MKKGSITRRSFVGAMCAVGAAAAAGGALGAQPEQSFAAEGEMPAAGRGKPLEAVVDPGTGELKVNEDVIIRNSACLGCYSSCGNRVKMDRATKQILSVAGNPYHPSCMTPHMEFTEPLEEEYLSMSYAAGKGNARRATVCGRGQATLDGYRQPDRVTTPLKRAGKRGEGKWEAIGWDQLIKEVTEGGRLFEACGEDREVEGFKAIHDTKAPMDPSKPGLGPKSNQLVMLGGRGDGRTVIGSRFINCFGSINSYGHGASCGGAQYVRAITETATRTATPDLANTEYCIFMGQFPGATGKSFQHIAKEVSSRVAKGELKVDVIDPVLGNGCVTPTLEGINWLPVKPATNAAFSCGLISWMIENEAYNAEFLSFPNCTAAYAAGYASCSNATFLVVVDEESELKGKLLTPEAAGLPYTPDPLGKIVYKVVMDAETGKPMLSTDSPKGVLEYEGKVNGVRVKSAFLLMEESVMSRSREEYAEICGIPVEEIERIAKEFSSHGVKACAQSVGGTATATGADDAVAMRILHAMIGANQMSGGASVGRCGAPATADGACYLLASVEGHPGITKDNATYISRNAKPWGMTDEYAARVAAGEQSPKPKLPWFASGTPCDNQALQSIVNQYPYQCKILISWMNNCIQATPGAFRDETIERLKDPAVLPLHIAVDVVIGEHAQLADYIVPDTNPYESFGVITQEGAWAGKGNAVRWPVKEPDTMLLPDGRHASFEAFIIDVAKACGVPGFGKNAVADTKGKNYPINDACDYFLKAVANLANDGVPVGPISESDIKLQALDELPEAWRDAVKPSEWPQVLNVLSRGGRFWPVADGVDPAGRSVYAVPDFTTVVYSEMRGSAKNPYSGKVSGGVLKYEPEKFADMSFMTDHFSADEFPFKGANYKPRFRSVTTLANSPIMQDLSDGNYLEINDLDAAELGIRDGDTIRITAATGEVMEGRCMARAGIARGTFGMSWGYGHRAYGAQDIEVDGQLTKGDKRIAAGIHMQNMTDPTVSVDGALYFVSDPDSAVPARNGGMYKIEKA